MYKHLICVLILYCYILAVVWKFLRPKEVPVRKSNKKPCFGYSFNFDVVGLFVSRLLMQCGTFSSLACLVASLLPTQVPQPCVP